MRDWNSQKPLHCHRSKVSIINNPYEGLKRVPPLGMPVPRVSIINNPYEGLKPNSKKSSDLVRSYVSIINNPYEGLKPNWPTDVHSIHPVSIINNPYEGLKLRDRALGNRHAGVSIINNPYEGLKQQWEWFIPILGTFQLSIIPMRDWNSYSVINATCVDTRSQL